MASKALTTSNFISQLLAPLPADAEPADSAKFVRQLAKDAEARWHKAWLKLKTAEYYRDGARTARTYNHLYGEVTDKMKQEERFREQLFYIAFDELMKMPAARKPDLNWKKKYRGYDGGRAEWDEAIAIDEAKFAS